MKVVYTDGIYDQKIGTNQRTESIDRRVLP